MILLTNSKGSDQTAQLPRLIWDYVVCTCPKTYFCMAWPHNYKRFCKKVVLLNGIEKKIQKFSNHKRCPLYPSQVSGSPLLLDTCTVTVPFTVIFFNSSSTSLDFSEKTNKQKKNKKKKRKYNLLNLNKSLQYFKIYFSYFI